MRVAVLGAGYAGLTVARRLERALPEAADLVVVDERDYHLVQHELHRVVRHPELAETLRVPLPEVLDRADIRQARVTDVDTEAGVVTLRGDETLAYDYAAVCLGAETEFYGLSGVEEYGIPLKRLEHADRIRARFFAAEGGRTVVGGAGLSGVQVAGELAALAAEEGFDADVTLLERLDSVAPGFEPAFQSAVRDALEAAGVTVRTSAPVTSATEDTVRLESGAELDYDTFVWAGGIRGPAALDGERVRTRADLRVGDGTFVVGDVADVVDSTGTVVPASAQAAIREGRVAARNIASLVREDLDGHGGLGPSLDRYRFDAPGWIVSVGDDAVAKVGPSVLGGDAAKAAKATVGAGYLSSVGAVANAASLVRDELGWPTASDVGDADG
jgi:NADH dehydrogenase